MNYADWPGVVEGGMCGPVTRPGQPSDDFGFLVGVELRCLA